MTEMVERVARVLCEAEGRDADSKWRNYRVRARAAIAAMREPSDEMRKSLKVSSQWYFSLIIEGWYDMIDAALEGKCRAG